MFQHRSVFSSVCFTQHIPREQSGFNWVYSLPSPSGGSLLFMHIMHIKKISILAHAAELQRSSRNQFLHLQLQGKTTPPNYVIDYEFPLQTWKEVNFCYWLLFNNQLFRGRNKKRRSVAINAWNRCRFAPPKVTQRVSRGYYRGIQSKTTLWPSGTKCTSGHLRARWRCEHWSTLLDHHLYYYCTISQ